MIVVKVELHSAVTGLVQELARMHICNTGEINSNSIGDYIGESFRGRDKETLNKRTVQKSTEIKNWPKARFHVWNLVSLMLIKMGYVEGHKGYLQ